MRVFACCEDPRLSYGTIIHSTDPSRTQKMVECASCGVVQEGAIVDWVELDEKLSSGEWHTEELPGTGGWVTRIVHSRA